MIRSRYRGRTWLREHAPGPLSRLFPYAGDCGDHEWFRFDEVTDVCRHCLAGEREHVPFPLTVGGPEWNGLVDGIAHGSQASGEILVSRLRETAAASNEAR